VGHLGLFFQVLNYLYTYSAGVCGHYSYIPYPIGYTFTKLRFNRNDDNMTHKKQKAAFRLEYRVGQIARKNSQQIDNRSDKLTPKINAKQSLAFFY